MADHSYVTTFDSRALLSDFTNFILTVLAGIFGIFIYVIITGVVFRDEVDHLFSIGNFYPILASTVTFIFLLILIIRSVQAHVHGIQYLVLIGFCAFAVNLLQVLDWRTAANHTPFLRPLNSPILNLSDVFVVLMLLFMYLHFESLLNYRFNQIRMLLLTLILFPMLVLNLLLMITNNNELNQSVELLLPLFALAVVFVAMFGLQTMIKIYFSNDEKSIKFGALIMMSSINAMMFSFVSQARTNDKINFILFEGEIFQLLLFAIATSMLSIVYIRNPRFLYSHPFKIYELFVYDKNGIPIWNYHLIPMEDPESDKRALKAAALSAIGYALKEVTGFRGKIQNVEFSDGELIISDIGEYYACLISDRRTVPLIGALNQFGQNSVPIIKKVMEQGDIEDHSIILNTELMVILKKYFPFVKSK